MLGQNDNDNNTSTHYVLRTGHNRDVIKTTFYKSRLRPRVPRPWHNLSQDDKYQDLTYQN